MSISLIAHTSKATGGTTSGIDTTGANVIVAVTAWTTATISESIISDSNSNTWIRLCRDTSISSCEFDIWMTIGSPSVGSGHTFMFTGGTSSVCVAAFSGATLFPVINSTHASAVSATVQPGSLTPAVDGALLVTGLVSRSATTYSIDSSFTITDQQPFSAGTNMGVGLAYLVQGTAAAINPTWTAGTATSIATGMVILQPTPSAGGSGGGAWAYA